MNSVSEKSKILVCDDSKLVRMTAKKILSDRFHLLLAEDGEAAWQLLNSDKEIKVVFTDLGMPNLDGWGLIERVRNCDCPQINGLPLIVVTGATETEDIKRKLYDIGATDFITKPFTATAIIARADAHSSYVKINTALKDEAYIDLDTGLLNAKGFTEQIAKDVSFVNRHKENLALSTFELDEFSNLSTRFKPNVTNVIIKKIAEILQQTVRKEDSVGRVDSCRFMISFPMAKSEGVIKLSKRLNDKIKSCKVNVGGEEIKLSASIGIATYVKGNITSLDEITRTSIKALENAKALGKGEVQFLKVDPIISEEEVVSIDECLSSIDAGETKNISHSMDSIIRRLSPLVSLMTKEQKIQLFNDD